MSEQENAGSRAAAKKDETEPRYTRADWKARARQLKLDGRSVSPHAVAAALYDVKADSTFSEEQLMGRLKKVAAKQHEVSS